MHEDVDTIAANIADWTQANAEHTDASAEKAWAHPGILWGVFAIPEEQVGALPESVEGLDVVELGCGTAYFGSWLQRRGARVTGVDPTPAQLATARRMMAMTGIEFPLVEAPGEAVPLPDAAYDLAVSEYGASLWADPYRWVPEAFLGGVGSGLARHLQAAYEHGIGRFLEFCTLSGQSVTRPSASNLSPGLIPVSCAGAGEWSKS